MKKFFTTGLLIYSLHVFSQVGIDTKSPNATLDINGDVILRNTLSVGGTDDLKGNPGITNQVLVSQGETKSPIWMTSKVPFMESGQYKLINTFVSEDQIGITSLSNGVAGDGVFLSNPDELYITTPPANTAKWIKITQLSTPLEVKALKNKITYQFQTGVEIVSTSAAGNVRFMCGIFKDNKLVAMRPDKINVYAANTPNQYIYTLNYTQEDEEIGSYTIDVACRKIETSDNTNYFVLGNKISGYGTNAATPNTTSNSFALKSFFKIDIAEHVTYTAN
ncbi:hypothetical protein [Chryseobacterium sp. T1]